jgi:hypothetical protein
MSPGSGWTSVAAELVERFGLSESDVEALLAERVAGDRPLAELLLERSSLGTEQPTATGQWARIDAQLLGRAQLDNLELAAVRAEQRRTGQLLTTILLSRRLISASDLTNALCDRSNGDTHTLSTQAAILSGLSALRVRLSAVEAGIEELWSANTNALAELRQARSRAEIAAAAVFRTARAAKPSELPTSR